MFQYASYFIKTHNMKLTLNKLINKDLKNALNKALLIFVCKFFHGNIFSSTSDCLYGISDKNPKEYEK